MSMIVTERMSFTQYGDEWPPEDAMGFIAWVQAKVDEIPERYRNTATIEFDGDPECCGNEIKIEWKRHETAEDAEKRRKTEEYRRANPHLRRPWW